MATITRVLSVAIGAAAACHLQTVQILLPALYTSLLSQLQALVIPPLILALCFLLTKRLPPILGVLPLFTFPPISTASFPLTDLILISVVVSVTCFHNPIPTCLAFLFVYASSTTPFNIPSPLLSKLPSQSHLPVIIVSLTATHLAARSRTLATFQFPTKWVKSNKQRPNSKAVRRRRTLPQPLLFALFFLTTLLISTFLRQPLTSLIRTVHPRPLPYNYKLLAQGRGPTGLISVVEATNRHRMLTADMSVLGGYHIKAGYYPDSIFSQFYVHEAVRLSRLPGESEDIEGGRDGRVLCIGVGVGVVAQALHRHSSIVDPVELDPVVARFARTWFNVEPRIKVTDGLLAIAEARNETYDFIVHDVFTGGGVAAELFSIRTFMAIKRVMKKDGVLAVNFVGGLEHPPTPATGAAALVYSRLKKVFGNVRAFSDGLESRNHNIVFFSGTAGEVTFRNSVEDDWLGSLGRKQTLATFQEHEVGDKLAKVDTGDGSDWLLFAGTWDIAAEHRAIMREVHPLTLWKSLLAAERSV